MSSYRPPQYRPAIIKECKAQVQLYGLFCRNLFSVIWSKIVWLNKGHAEKDAKSILHRLSKRWVKFFSVSSIASEIYIKACSQQHVSWNWIAASSYHKILWFHVSVYNVSGVKITESASDVFHHPCSSNLIKPRLLRNLFKQISSLSQNLKVNFAL